MAYQCEAKNEAAFVQQLVRYANAGYRFYVVGIIGDRKPAEHVDARLIEKFAIDKSSQARSRAKQRGEANVQYIRLGCLWVMLATEGKHRFFEDNRSQSGDKQWHDLRAKALRVGPYAISSKLDGGWKKDASKLRRYRTRVTLTREAYKELVAFFEDKAAHWSRENLEARFEALGQRYLAYRPVREQLIQLVKRVNRKRKLSGYEKIPYTCLKMPSCVRTIKVFGKDRVKEESSSHRIAGNRH